MEVSSSRSQAWCLVMQACCLNSGYNRVMALSMVERPEQLRLNLCNPCSTNWSPFFFSTSRDRALCRVVRDASRWLFDIMAMSVSNPLQGLSKHHLISRQSRAAPLSNNLVWHSEIQKHVPGKVPVNAGFLESGASVARHQATGNGSTVPSSLVW